MNLLDKIQFQSICSTLLLGVSLLVQTAIGQTLVTAKKTVIIPSIDGIAENQVWNAAQDFVVHDTVAGIDLHLKALYNDSDVFFLVQYADADESRIHKAWIWNKEQKVYEVGPKREDTFVFKWSLSGNDADLRLRGAHPHKADIWFWKANRTDPAGYADDKIQILSEKECRKCKKLMNAQGQIFYLLRRGDAGQSAYKVIIPAGKEAEEVGQFASRQPAGSRADIRAKGKWQDGMWTIEFSRKLDTGHEDDILFDISKKYLFGVSRYEIAGREADPKLSQPLYGSGDVGEPLLLQFGD